MTHYALKAFNNVEWIVTKLFEGDEATVDREFREARAKMHEAIPIVIEKLFHDPNVTVPNPNYIPDEDADEEAPAKRVRRKE